MSCAEESRQVFDRELDRVADRLRVLGPRLATPPGERIALARQTLQQVADLTSDAEGTTRRAVPALSPYALADQLLVLGHDLLAADDPAALAAGTDLLVRLRRTL